MAGRRRQSQVRDTASTLQQPQSVSHVASIVPTTANAVGSEVIEIAESVHEDSTCLGSPLRPKASVHRSTTAFCKKCSSRVGEFYNSWHKATRSYYSPALLGSYRSLLRIADQRKEASDKTELAGCTINLTICPACNECLGFVVVDAPPAAKRFRGREFLKLHRIELRCEVSPDQIITVEPQEDVAPDLVAPEGSTTPSPGPDRITKVMDVSTPLSSSHPLWAQPAQSKQHQHHLPSPRDGSHGHALQSNEAHRPTASSRSPTDQSFANRGTAPNSVSFSAAWPPGHSRPRSTSGASIKDPQQNGQNSTYSYPRKSTEVQLDAIERLQIQTAQNTSALAAQARSQIDYADIVRQIETSLRAEFRTLSHRQDEEMRKMHEYINQFSQDLQDCRRTILELVQENNVNRAERARRPSTAQPGYQDEALEMMAQRIGDVSRRTADLETLRDHVAIMNGKIQRLEAESAPAQHSHQRPSLSAYQIPHPVHSTQPPPPLSTQVSTFQAPPRPAPILQSVQHHEQPVQHHEQPVQHHEQPVAAAPPESAQRQEPIPSQNGWVTVNAGVKRPYENGTNSPHQGVSSVPGSPKRPKLVPSESQDGRFGSQVPSESSYILPSQVQPIVDSQPIVASQPVVASQPIVASQMQSHSGPHPGPHTEIPPSQIYTPYGTPNGPTQDNWRSESQRAVESRPLRGRGSRGGRGPGSRGGRVRKNMQARQYSGGTPEGDRNGWSTVPSSQASPDGFEDHPSHLARSVIRRGGGGSGMQGRPNDWTPEIGPRSVFHDSPSETKKTRSKPIRNEEGILVRKDGRPDRRSQSSAANLRKVHARKEEQQREGEAGSTPASNRPSMSAGPDTPSPTPRDHSESYVTNSMRKKHNDILGRIFPDGIDSSRRQHNYAHQVFNEDRDHTAHPRAPASRPSKNPLQIKREHVERSDASRRSPANSDVDMDREASPRNGRSRDSTEATVAASANDSQRTRIANSEGETQESSVQVPETQATGRSGTHVTESMDTA